ncbi:ANTAR domain-containing protein [Streptomyces albidus (ex Kaewkla and Franco 2022)]|uniref:ANTAR domain-containing protein n=1 Tax=Streptomyces albidus (ex Kaewkla and Franco 2022) TaxID=722709 RepID=UPI0015EF15F0|nr:ANTAR domain-containing protein [Streptomyces albidus (ex Kaewkla and Franco 2022)]
MGDAETPHAELEQLRRAMETRPVIDQAHGVLMAAYRCAPSAAWDALVAVSQNTNVKLHKVAAALVESTQGEPLPEPFSSALRAALGGASPTRRSSVPVAEASGNGSSPRSDSPTGRNK